MSLSIAFEGPDGVGKTTQTRIFKTLLEKGFGIKVLSLIEPGGTPAGDEIRNILLGGKNRDMDPATHMLLFSASRNELIKKVMLPWMTDNPQGVVITDRCWWSTFAFQKSDGADEDYIRDVQRPFAKIWPDVPVLIDIPVEESKVRLEVNRRLGLKTNWRDEESESKFRKIREKYLLMAEHPDTILVDGFESPWGISLNLVNRIRDVPKAQRDGISELLGPEKLRISLESMIEIERVHTPKGDMLLSDVIKMVDQTRIELGFEVEKMRAEMHSEWRIHGLERFSSGIERGK